MPPQLHAISTAWPIYPVSDARACTHLSATCTHQCLWHSYPAASVAQDWALVSSTKKMHRYHPPEVVQGMEALARATELLQAAAKQAWQDFLTDFAGLYAPFKAAVQAVAALDALNSLAIVAAGEGWVPCSALV